MVEQKILVIEDDPATQVNLYDVLQSKGFQVMLAGSETVGLWMLDEQMPNLVISGIEISSSKRCDVLKSIRQHAATLAIPIVFLISEASEMDRIYGCCKLLLDTSTCITKPFTAQTLLSVIMPKLSQHAH